MLLSAVSRTATRLLPHEVGGGITARAMASIPTKAINLMPKWYIRYNNDVWRIVKAADVARGRAPQFVQMELKSVTKGIKSNIRMRSMDVVDKINFDFRRKLVVQYRKGKEVLCTDPATGEEVSVPATLIASELLPWVHEGMEIEEVGADEEVIYIEVPQFGNYAIASVSPPQDQSSSRGITLETGQRIKGAAFLKVGDVVKVRLEDGAYVECVKRA